MTAGKKVAIGIGIGAGIAALLLWTRKAGGATPPPPSPGKSTIWGILTDKATGNPVEGIVGALDTAYSTTSNSSGRFSLENIEPGTYNLLTFTDPQGRYEKAEVTSLS